MHSFIVAGVNLPKIQLNQEGLIFQQERQCVYVTFSGCWYSVFKAVACSVIIESFFERESRYTFIIAIKSNAL